MDLYGDDWLNAKHSTGVSITSNKFYEEKKSQKLRLHGVRNSDCVYLIFIPYVIDAMCSFHFIYPTTTKSMSIADHNYGCWI